MEKSMWYDLQVPVGENVEPVRIEVKIDSVKNLVGAIGYYNQQGNTYEFSSGEGPSGYPICRHFGDGLEYILMGDGTLHKAVKPLTNAEQLSYKSFLDALKTQAENDEFTERFKEEFLAGRYEEVQPFLTLDADQWQKRRVEYEMAKLELRYI